MMTRKFRVSEIMLYDSAGLGCQKRRCASIKIVPHALKNEYVWCHCPTSHGSSADAVYASCEHW